MKRSTFWLVAALLAVSPGLARVQARDHNQPSQKANYDQGHAMKSQDMMAAYNAPARIDVRGSWDIFAYGSFIWWNPIQEGMELAISDDTNTVNLPIVNGRVINMDFKYKPGFKVALGINMDHDNWDGIVEYTWLHFTQRQSSGRPVSGILRTIQAHPENVPEAVSTSAKWRASLDIVNAELARSYYVGTHLTFRTHFGARLALIDQRFVPRYNPSTNETSTVRCRNTSDSWGLGPRAGLDSNWLLGLGFRVFGNAAADILYTRYKLKTEEDQAANPNALALRVKDKISYLRPHAELQMGLGWGTYFDNNNWHVDLAASYDFHVFWNQNMFRQFYSSTSEGLSSLRYGDLFLHGLTVTLRFDF